jgi:hypothetical protein
MEHLPAGRRGCFALGINDVASTETTSVLLALF